MVLLVICCILGLFAGLFILQLRSRGLLQWCFSKVGNVLTALAAIVIGTISTTHICTYILSYPQSPESVWNAIQFTLHFLESRNSSDIVWNTAFAVSLATCLAWNILCYEDCRFKVATQLIWGTSVGTNVGIVTGISDKPTVLFVSFVGAVICSVTVQFLDLTVHLFVKWITELVINVVRNSINDYVRNEVSRLPKSSMSRVRSFVSWFWEEQQEELAEDEFPALDVVTLVTVISATTLGGIIGIISYVTVFTHVPYFNKELESSSDWKSPFAVSAVAAVGTTMAMKIPLVSTWSNLRVLVELFVGVSLGTNSIMAMEQIEMERAVLIASCASLAVMIIAFLRLPVMSFVKWRRIPQHRD